MLREKRGSPLTLGRAALCRRLALHLFQSCPLTATCSPHPQKSALGKGWGLGGRDYGNAFPLERLGLSREQRGFPSPQKC